MRGTRTGASLLVSGLAIGLLWPGAAAADQNYQTQKYPLTAVGGAPLASGFVLNVHANGPVIYGQERYTLRGAEPSTTYQVTLTLYSDEDCMTIAAAPVELGGFPLVFPTVELTTNAVGNGQAKATFSATQVAPLIPQPATVPGVWTFSRTDGEASTVAYATGCQLVDLDVPPPPPPGRARP